MLGKLYGNVDLLKAALDGSSLKYQSINNNMANVNTPGYKKATVSFEEELQKIVSGIDTKISLSKTHSDHMGKSRSTLDNFKPIVNKHEGTSTRKDKNNVNPDIEMIEMAKTMIQYNALIDRINGKFNSIQSVIKEGSQQ